MAKTRSAKVATKATAKTVKAITKAKRTESEAKKKTVSQNKAPAKAKKTAISSNKVLDLCLLLDCTSSMWSWIERSKDTLKEIIESIKDQNPDLTVRASFTGYRDIRDTKRFEVIDFDEDLDKVKNFIKNVKAEGGADFPEDVQGGFNKALNLNWAKNSVKTCFHIADAPGHGKNITGPYAGDDYPNGSPDGFIFED